MSSFSRELIGRSGYAIAGFADAYDGARPSPPAVVLDVLERCAGGRPRLVIDLGSGTGLVVPGRGQTGPSGWSASRPTRRCWRLRGRRRGPRTCRSSRATPTRPGSPPGSADIVTCAQSFHWMDPRTVLPRWRACCGRAGVFAAYDYDVVPVIEPRVDAAFSRLIDVRWEARERLGIHAGPSAWPKSEHAARIRESGRFAFAREVHCHTELAADGRQVDRPGLLAGRAGGHLPGPGARAGRGHGRSEAARRWSCCPEPRPMLLGYTLRIGITPRD